MPDEDWIDNILWLPPVEFGQIYTYLIDTLGQFTREINSTYGADVSVVVQ